MIITGEKNIVESSGGEVKSFQIEMNKKAFTALSSGIYSNKPLAIVRELSCNAYDAHVVAGKLDTQFEVHVPNWSEPYFEVKDFGNGLSEDEINSLYTTYFASSKSMSNDAIGCWGLGSKSPFCYCDQFTIESRQNGKVTFYNAFKNEEGFPCISKQGECDTVEPNGLTVKVPIKSSDFYDFKYNIEKLFRWWKNKPKITGAPVDILEIKFSVIENEYGFTENYTDTWGILMGGIFYSLENYDIPKHLYKLLNSSIKKHLVIFAKIGDVDIVISREKLEFTNKTKNYINTTLEKVQKSLLDKFNNEIALLPSLNDAKKFAKTYPIKFEEFIYNNIKYNNNYIFEIQTLTSSGKELRKLNSNHSLSKREKFGNKCYYLEYFDDIPVVYVNSIHNFIERLHQWMKANSYDNIYYFKDNEYNDLFKEYGFKVKEIESLPKPIKQVLGTTKNYTAVFKKWYPTYHYESSWRDIKIDINQVKGLYVNMIHRQVQINGRGLEFSYFKKLMETIIDIDPNVEVYWVTPKFNKHLDKAGWKTLESFVRDKISTISDNDYEDFYNEALSKIPSSLKIINSVEDKKSPANLLIEEIREINKAIKKIKSKEKIVKLHRVFFKHNLVKFYEIKNLQSCIDRYTLINNFDYCSSNVVESYINMVDFCVKNGKNF